MRTANPTLSDKSIQRAAEGFQPGWAAAHPRGIDGSSIAAPAVAHDSMTMGGVLTACGVLIVLLLGAAAFGWSQVEQTSVVDATTGEEVSTTQIPGWIWVAFFGALAVAIVTAFVPRIARFTSPIYALAIGVGLGAISAVYNIAYDGIVLQAVMCTAGVFLTMLFLYGTRIIRVTRKLYIGIIAATGGVFLVYFASAIYSIFSDNLPTIYEAGPIGIGFSLLVVGIAAFNLLLDFDFIERGIEVGLPKGMEWYAAFGLVVTLVWLYIEMLRLLSKLRQ